MYAENNDFLEGAAPQITGEIVKNRLTYNGNIRPIFSLASGFVDFAKTDMLIWTGRQSWTYFSDWEVGFCDF